MVVPIELKPVSVRCNIQCQYCYQNPLRDAGNLSRTYNLEKMKAAIEKEGGPFALFGGEPLLLPEADLEALWLWGLKRYGRNSLQTNGTLIKDSHIILFKKYKVDVGISVDGPAELNDARWAGTLQLTREATAKVHAAIERLCQEGIPPGLIVTLHRGNATRDKLPEMHQWFKHLEQIGIRAVKLHVLEVEAQFVREKYFLSIQENVEALLSLMQLQKEELRTLQFDLFRDMRDLLLGRDAKSSCVWNACDPYTTRAVRGIEGQGQSSNCSRTNKEGIDFLKSDAEGFERYLALYQTPQDHGGCKDCRFFLMCKGQCPGTAIDGDWRNRTEYCEVWKRLYAHMEKSLLAEGEKPISLCADRLVLERVFVRCWQSGRNTTIAHSLEQLAHWRSSQARSCGSPRSAGNQKRSTTRDSEAPLPCSSKADAFGISWRRLDSQLPHFTRMLWVSRRAKDLWEPRLLRIMKAWADVEWRSVPQGVRRCAVTVASPEAFVAKAPEWASNGLNAMPISLEGPSHYSYRSAARKAELGESYAFRIVIGSPEVVSAFKRALDAHDDQTIGALLGYPPCCRMFLRKVLVEQRLMDTTWEMATRGAVRSQSDGVVEIAGPAQSNIFWRWAGIRAVPHLPCRSDCERSIDLADRLLDTGRRIGYVAEIDWLMEILSWPVEWSALHGIAEIRTPILKMATPTDPTPRKHVVQRQGTSYPAEGAEGLRFPYRQTYPLRLTDSTAFRRGLVDILVSASRGNVWSSTVERESSVSDRSS